MLLLLSGWTWTVYVRIVVYFSFVNIDTSIKFLHMLDFLSTRIESEIESKYWSNRSESMWKSESIDFELNLTLSPHIPSPRSSVWNIGLIVDATKSDTILV